MSDLEKQFQADVAAVEAEYQAFKQMLEQQMPSLAHVVFVSPICAVHNIPADQCGCP